MKITRKSCLSSVLFGSIALLSGCGGGNSPALVGTSSIPSSGATVFPLTAATATTAVPITSATAQSTTPYSVQAEGTGIVADSAPIPVAVMKPPTSPLQSLTADQIRAIPLRVTVQGKSLVATAAVWINRMPGTNPSNTASASINIHTEDGSQMPPILIDRVSVANGSEVWSSTGVSDRTESVQSEASIQNGPAWSTGATVDIAADFYDNNGQRYQVRGATTTIRNAY